MVEFGKKLSLLIDTFSSNNSKLARAIKVDASLVSKWINSKRIPSPNSPYITDIAEYFLGKTSLKVQQVKLVNILKVDFPHLNADNKTLLKDAIIEWLIIDDGNTNTHHILMVEKEESPKEFIDNALSDLRSMPRKISEMKKDPREKLVLEVPYKAGTMGSYEIFKSREGKRQAVFNFLSLVISSSTSLELLLVSGEDMKWLTEDLKFLNTWAMLLKNVLEKGHRIIVIHKVNRDMVHIKSIMNYWIPLHLTGRVTSYYYPKYDESNFEMNLFIARGIAAVISANSIRNEATDYTFLHKDPVMIKFAEEHFMSYLSNCRQLVNLYLKDKMKKLNHDVVEIEKGPGCYFSLKEGLSSLTISVELYSKLVQKTGYTEAEKNEFLQLHTQRLRFFNSNIKYYSYREFYSIDVIDDLINEEGIIYPSTELFFEEAVKLDPSDVLEHLQNIVELLTNNKNYEVFLLGRKDNLMSNKMCLTLKEDHSTIISCSDDKGNNPISITLSEGNVIQAMESYFENIYDQVPVMNRDKDWTIKKLMLRIKRLEDIVK